MAPNTMRALVCRKLGDPTLPLSDASPIHVSETHPKPTLSSSTAVRVKVVASSLNFATGLVIQGKYQERPALPYVPGEDFSGIVLEVGEKVKHLKVGDRVCGAVELGAYAEELVDEASKMYKVPDGCDLVQAGGLPVAFGTSHVGLVHRANLQAGQVWVWKELEVSCMKCAKNLQGRGPQVLLVLGAAGGVGSAAVQIGKALGAVVIAAARGKEKEEMLKGIGADFVVDPSDGGLIKSVQAFLKSRKLRGVDVLYDPVGGKLYKDSMKLLNWGAQILIIGFTSGEIPTIPANILLVKNLTAHGLYWGSYMKFKPEIIQNSMQELLQMLAKGSLRVNVSHTFPLSQANKAFATIQERQVIGKVMLLPGNNAENPISRL